MESRDGLLPTTMTLGGYRKQGIVCCQYLCHWKVIENKGESAVNISATGRFQRTRESLLPRSLLLGSYREENKG
jgi:hypothetical protein